jgi:hypothetical protein
MTFGVPSGPQVVMIPADDGKKQGQRARSSSGSTCAAAWRGSRRIAIPSRRSSPANVTVVAAGKR